MVNELKVLMADPVLHISLPSREEVVHHCHLMTVHHQLVSEVGPHKTSPTGDLLEESVTFFHVTFVKDTKQTNQPVLSGRSEFLFYDSL